MQEKKVNNPRLSIRVGKDKVKATAELVIDPLADIGRSGGLAIRKTRKTLSNQGRDDVQAILPELTSPVKQRTIELQKRFQRKT